MQLKTSLKPLILSGLIAELCFEFYAWMISPLLFGLTLEPARLVTALAKLFFGLELSYGLAFAVHFSIGAIGFAAVVYLVKRMLKRSYLLAGLASGVGLWFVAQGILAPVVGRSFMMGFGPYTQSSFIAHVGMTVILAMTWQYLTRRHVALT